jgi:uncharacterized damage-inducible protein DinB
MCLAPLEAPFIRRTLERVPLDKGPWKPHVKSMTMGWLATFLAVMWSWGVITIEQESFDPAARAGAGQRPPEPETTEALLQLFDKNLAAFRAALAGTNDEHLHQPWTLMPGGKPFFTQPRWLVLRTYILNHAVHHRAQMGVYLRLNGIDVPAIYNDSADEKGGMFR